MQAAKTRKIFDNRYEILSIVGRSKHSVVYHARHVMAPATEVALKVLLSRKDMQSNADRLRKEALAMVSCRHRYVIRLDDFHSVGDLCYLSMEYAPESDLRKYVERSGGVLPPTQAQLFMSQVAEALAFCHRAGITHRDIKQDNILVVNDREVRLADFSVALLPGDESSLEELQRGVGSMDYMAPEVLEGRASEQRSDLYSLGVTFYELLSGKHPFSSAPLLQQLEIRRDGAFQPLQEVAPHVPKPLAEIVMKCLRYSLNDRPASAQEIIDQLAQGLPKMRPATQGAPVQSATPSPSAGTVAAQTPPPSASVVPSPVPPQPMPPKTSPATPVKPSEQSSPHAALATGPIPTKFALDSESTASTEARKPTVKATEVAVESSSVTAVTQPIPFTSGQTKTAPSERVEREQKSTAETKATTPPARRVRTNTPPQSTEELLQQRSNRAKTEHIDQNLVAQIRAHREKISPAGSSATTTTPAPTPQKPEAKRGSAPRGDRLKTMLAACIVGVLAGILYIGAQFLTSGIESTESTSSPAASTDAPVSEPVIAQNVAPLSFPHLPGGIYPGAINGLVPNQELPLTLVSLPESKRLIVIVGIEGWSPTVVDLSTLSETDLINNAPVRAASNGFVLELSGTPMGDGVQGTFLNRVTREEGTWFIARNSVK